MEIINFINKYQENQQKIYFFVLACFKLAVGSTLLLVGWDSMIKIPGNSYLNIAIVTFLSFSPAALSKILFERFKKTQLNYVVAIALFIAPVLILSICYLINISLLLSGLIYFLVWTIYFLIENCNEKWFMILSDGLSVEHRRKFSSTSTSIAQLFTMLGPALVVVSRKSSENFPYVILVLTLLTGAIVALKHKNNHTTTNSEGVLETKKIISKKAEVVTIITFSTIWSCIAIFNMIIPIIAKKFYSNSISYAAFFEIIFGLSMALSGFLYPFICNRLRIQTEKLWVVIPLLSLANLILIALFYDNLILFSLSLFCMGLFFSFYRIESRSIVSQIFTSSQAGSLIASANALSSPLVFLFIWLGYLEFELLSSNKNFLIILPLTFLMSKSLFSITFRILNKGI